MPYLETDGVCPICQRGVRFRAENEWLRDSFLCDGCGSIPRERAFFSVIEMLYPNWRDLHIHETSPAMRAASLKLKTECQSYSYSYNNAQMTPGSIHQEEGYRCEDIEKLTFDDKTFDLFLSQDVFEHIFHPDRAIKEIERVLEAEGRLYHDRPNSDESDRIATSCENRHRGKGQLYKRGSISR